VDDNPYDAGIGTPTLFRRMLEVDAFVVITVDRVATHATRDGGETEFGVRTDVHGEPLMRTALDGERVDLRAAIGVV
jgi:hypothetical protein